MDIRLKSKSYKSIAQFEWLNVPSFAVVTGPNGAGKTQLLEMIARGLGLSFQPEGMQHSRGELPPFNAEVSVEPGLPSTNVVFLRSGWPSPLATATLDSVIQLARQAWEEGSGRSARPQLNWSRLWAILEQKLSRKRGEISYAEFSDALPPNFPLLSDSGFMDRGIGALFVSYLHSIDVLMRKRNCIEAEAEIELGPLPWHVLNDVLKAADFSYRVVIPSLPTYQRYNQTPLSYTLGLEDRDNGQQIQPADLSAGERVMFQVALWYFSFAQRRKDNVSEDIDRLLLLDEPDAHLHPALTRTFLDVVQEELVKKHGIRVLMTTHSPSTVALAPEAGIFVMSRVPPRIRPAESRWKALSTLTAGFLTIGSESKCVFVEDRDDRDFFETLRELLSDPDVGHTALDASRSIVFIAASEGNIGAGRGPTSGGREEVKKFVAAIPNTQIAGIIDRDDGNLPSDRIHVLERHSLENYLLDPLFLFAILLEQQRAPAISDVSLRVHDGRRLLAQDAATLQSIADVMLSEMRALVGIPSTRDRAPVRYFNGPQIQLDTWFLETSAKPLFEPLKTRFGLPLKREYLIKQYRLIRIVPSELVEMLKKIQDA